MYVNIIENINKNINVIIIDIATPFNMYFEFLKLFSSMFDHIPFIFHIIHGWKRIKFWQNTQVSVVKELNFGKETFI